MVLMDANGTINAWSEGPSTNHWVRLLHNYNLMGVKLFYLSINGCKSYVGSNDDE